MIGFIVDTEFVWGFQARIVGLSKTSPSFYYPPPTTFLGALAEVIAKDGGVGEREGREIISKLSENLLAIGVRPINCKSIKYEDLNRIIAVKITSGILYPNPKDLAKSFDSPARGKTILSSLDGNAPAIKWFLVFKNDKIKLNSDEVNLDENTFWKIHRLGSKESRVSVVDVKVVEDLDVVNDIVETTFSFPVTRDINIVKEETERNWVYEVYVNPFDVGDDPVKSYIEGKNILPFKVPILNTIGEEYFCRVKLEGNAVAYKFKDEVVIGWSK
jgi:CRISPR-associated protein Cas5a/b/c